MRKLTKFGLFLAILGLLTLTQPGYAIHFYRGPGSGCTPADGELTDDPLEDPDFVRGPITAEIQLWHNSFYDSEASDANVHAEVDLDEETLPNSKVSRRVSVRNETHVKLGDAVQWTWNSAHCHSVEVQVGVDAPASVYSGFHYPVTTPDSPQVVPGFFEYPVLTETPTLSFVHTFLVPGTYVYWCIHHRAIGMEAVVVVEP